jgi:hypothetical protein
MNLSRFELHPPLGPDERDLALRLTQTQYAHRVARWTTTAVGLCGLVVSGLSFVLTPEHWMRLGWSGAGGALVMVGTLFAVLYGFAYERAAKRTWPMLRREAGVPDTLT